MKNYSACALFMLLMSFAILGSACSSPGGPGSPGNEDASEDASSDAVASHEAGSDSGNPDAGSPHVDAAEAGPTCAVIGQNPFAGSSFSSGITNAPILSMSPDGMHAAVPVVTGSGYSVRLLDAPAQSWRTVSVDASTPPPYGAYLNALWFNNQWVVVGTKQVSASATSPAFYSQGSSSSFTAQVVQNSAFGTDTNIEVFSTALSNSAAKLGAVVQDTQSYDAYLTELDRFGAVTISPLLIAGVSPFSTPTYSEGLVYDSNGAAWVLEEDVDFGKTRLFRHDPTSNSWSELPAIATAQGNVNAAAMTLVTAKNGTDQVLVTWTVQQGDSTSSLFNVYGTRFDAGTLAQTPVLPIAENVYSPVSGQYDGQSVALSLNLYMTPGLSDQAQVAIYAVQTAVTSTALASGDQAPAFGVASPFKTSGTPLGYQSTGTAISIPEPFFDTCTQQYKMMYSTTANWATSNRIDTVAAQ